MHVITQNKWFRKPRLIIIENVELFMPSRLLIPHLSRTFKIKWEIELNYLKLGEFAGLLVEDKIFFKLC